MRTNRLQARSAALVGWLVCFTGLLVAGAAKAAPAVLWASDPVAPDETVLVVGDQLAEVSRIRIARDTDDPYRRAADSSESFEVRPLQVSPNSLKFVVPREIGAGAYRFAFDNDAARTYQLNSPSIYWLQGDQGGLSSAGGWVRVLGRNIARGPEARLTLAAVGQSVAVTLRSSAFSLWDAAFQIPADMPAGSYVARLWNGNGDAAAWRDAGVWQVGPRSSLPSTMVNVRDFGARGDGVRDDTAAVKAALAALADKGGGTLFLPRGYYRLSEALTLPAHVLLKGDDRALVRLIWPDFPIPPFALLEGSSDFAIEDITIVAFNHAHIISGGFLPGTDTAVAEAGNIAIRRVTVRASMYRGHLTQEQVAQRLQAALKFSTGGPDTVRLSGRNLTVEDSDVYGSGRSLYLNHPRGAHVAHNRFYNGRWGWYSISGAEGVIFEDNKVIGADLQSTGGGVNTLSKIEAFAENVAFLHNSFEMMHGWDREAMTSDGPGGCYFGRIAAVSDDGRSVNLLEPAAGGVLDLKGCVGAGIFILGGHGMGQVRRVDAIDGSSIRLDRSFDVAPDGSSVVSITSYQRNYLMIGNDFSDAGIAVQFFGSSVDHVVADNVSRRTGGFRSWGLQYGQYQPAWYTQFINNRILEGDLANDAALAAWGSQKAPNRAPLSIGTIIRDNRLEGDAHIEVKGYSRAAPGVRDVIVEHNEISKTETGILIDDGARGVLVRDNVFHDVVTPVVDKSAGGLQ